MFLVQIGNALHGRVVPEVLEVVMLARIREEHVHHHGAVVQSHPFGVGLTAHGGGFLGCVLACKLFHAVGHGFHLLRRASGADYEVFARRGVDAAEVCHTDGAAFLFLSPIK